MSPGSARTVVLAWCGRVWAVVADWAAGFGCCGTVWRWALVVVVLLVCPGGLGVGRCGVAGPGPWSGRRALLAGALAGPLVPVPLGLLGLVGVGGG